MISQILNDETFRTVAETTFVLSLSLLFRETIEASSAILLFTGTLTAAVSVITKSKSLTKLSHAINRTAIFSILGAPLIQPLLHEAGHAAMISLFFRSPRITVALNGCGGGVTSYLKEGSLTHLGQLMGFDNVQIIIAAGGFFSSLIIGYCTGPSFMIYVGMAKLLSEACYALTALNPNGWDCGHDYQFLRLYAGAHPLIPAAILLGIFIYKMHEAVKDNGILISGRLQQHQQST